MADNRYFGGITIGAAGFEVASPNPVDSRFRVKNQDGLAEITSLYEGLISYVESNKTYYQYTNGAWKALSINSAEELEALIKAQIAIETTGAMEFKGATATLPESPSKGDMWKVAGSDINITVDGVAAKTGDTIIYNGEAWVLIPSGDDIEDTWRPVIAGGNTLEPNETLELIAGDNVSITEEAGKVTISSSYENTHYESKLVVGNEATDASDENVVENGNVRLNLVENGEVKSSHKIIGDNGIEITHIAAHTEENEDGTQIEVPNTIEIKGTTYTFDVDETNLGDPDDDNRYVSVPFVLKDSTGTNCGGFSIGGSDDVNLHFDQKYNSIYFDLTNTKLNSFDIGEDESVIGKIPVIDENGQLASSGLAPDSWVDWQTWENALGNEVTELVNGGHSLSTIFGDILSDESAYAHVPTWVINKITEYLGFDPTSDEDYDVIRKIKSTINEAAGYEVFNISGDEETGLPGDGELLSPLAKIAQTGNIEDLVQTDNTYVVFNCGSSSTVI